MIVSHPLIVLDHNVSNRPRPVLEWYPILRRSSPCGQLLAAFELILDDEPDNAIPVRHPRPPSPRPHPTLLNYLIPTSPHTLTQIAKLGSNFQFKLILIKIQ